MNQSSAIALRVDKLRRLWMAILLGSFAAIAPLSTLGSIMAPLAEGSVKDNQPS